ncbi:LytTr DNA-binding domain-containing protein [Larkinella arboricola]|uniref:LytTr DNA-binding domain-containing protein n=1 Tax=Larkinella arboricola TaxID=643671 RepID=A0A327WXP6_LARAB|nr:LytTR family DNA-binding domain-containing protein [Larkinella arboricola]RAJ98122.1 LytTr DNA-binding domain-containing protein [Larkinella arboricola]
MLSTLPTKDATQKKDIILSDILFISTEGEKSWIVYLNNSKQQYVSTSGSLTYWEKKLPAFWRINESYLINPALIYRFHPVEMPHFPLPLVELITGRVLAISRQKRNLIQKKWNQLRHSLIS